MIKSVQDELFEILYKQANHELEKLEIIKESRENKIEEIKQECVIEKEEQEHLDKEIKYLERQIELQKELIEIYEKNNIYKVLKTKIYSVIYIYIYIC